jgi:hypothetical protein
VTAARPRSGPSLSAIAIARFNATTGDGRIFMSTS